MVSEIPEKRRASRRKEETLVRFEGENFSIYSKATNISEIGAFVATHYLLEPGTNIDFFVIDPDGKELSTLARVVRSSSTFDEKGQSVVGLGVEFFGGEASSKAL